jgi:PPM family protein phosphatase
MSNDPESLRIGAAVQVQVGGRSDQGRTRSENQDDFIIADLAVDAAGGVLLKTDAPTGIEPRELGQRGLLLVVADGMGGASAGGLASRLATMWIHQEVVARWAAERAAAPDRFIGVLGAAVERANERIFQQASNDRDLGGMGSTVTVAGILDGYAYLAQVGDSRGYLVRNGTCTQLTRDQSVVQTLVDAGTMTEEEAERSDRRNIILQALGTKANVDVDLTFQALRRGDVLVLCSDGLTRVVRAEEIAAHVLHAPDPQHACDALVALANERGAPDNVTVAIARFGGDGLQPPMSDDHVGRRVYHGMPY